jgi:kynureninase
MTALECGLDVFMAAEALGGMAALRRKSLALTDLFIALVEDRCAGHDLALVTPRNHDQRGSQVCLTRPTGAYAIVQALIARGVIGDYRAGTASGASPSERGDILRFGFAPLYTCFADVWHAVEQLRQVLVEGEWQRPEFSRKQAVT